MIKFKIISAVMAALIAAAALTGCDSGSGSSNTETSANSSAESSDTETSSQTDVSSEDGFEDVVMETRPIAEGDDYAINKINNKSPEDSLPGGYTLFDYTEENQGKYFVNGKAKIIIRAYNYKEDLQDMAIWADQACAIMAISNITSACDTNYSEPENVKVLGFDAIKYDYEIIQYEFLENEEDPEGEKIKNPIGTYKGIAYYFYSDQDAYAIMFDTAEADFEEQSKLFEEFVNDLEITKTEY